MSDIFRKECKFIIGATKISDIPSSNISEIAFAGRSNVGKSSLINALTGRKSLARVSQTPGRTKQINFFNIDDKISLVDLPGYGYARASKKEIAGWNNLIYDYLRGRPNLKRIYMLIDSRHGIKKNDIEMLNFLSDCAVVVHIVLTKCDKINQQELQEISTSVKEELSKHAICYPDVIVSSSNKKIGISELKIAINHLI